MIHLFLKNNILRAYGTSLLGVFSGLLTNLWLLREITRVIPARDFGIYAYVLQISGYLAILQLGLDFAASREIAESLGRQDKSGASRAFAELWRFNRGASLVAAAGVIGIAALLGSGLGLKAGSDPRAAHLGAEIALLAGVSQVITFFSRPYSAALIGSQFQATANILAVIRTFATTLLAFGLLKAGFYLFAVPAAEIVLQTFNFFALKNQARGKCDWLKSAPTPFARTKGVSSMVKFGGLASLGGIAWTLESGMDVLILGWFLNTQAVAAYVLWWRFPQMLFDFCSRLSFSAFPGFSHKFGVSPQAARVLLGKVADLTLGLSTLALVGIAIWLRPFMHLWIGPHYAGPQDLYLPLFMGILVCLRTGGNLLSVFWMSGGRAELTTFLGWCQMLLKLFLSLWLVPHLGILGSVLASCAAALLQVGVIGFFLLRKALLPAACVVRYFLLGGVALAAGLIGVEHAPSVGWLGLIGDALLTVVIWAALWFPVALTGELHQPLSLFVNGVTRVFRAIRPA